MQISLLLFKQIVSMFLMIMMGYILVKTRLIKGEESKGISMVVLYLVMPCVIINSFQVEYSSETVHGLLLAFLAAVLIHVILLVLIYPLGKLCKLDEVEKASVIYSNAANLIVPIVTVVLGEEWVIYSCAFISVQLILLWSHCRSMLSGEKGFEVKKVLGNVNMLAIGVGMVLFFTGIRLPKVLADTVSSVSAMVAPASMFVIGMLIADVKLKEILMNRRIYFIMTLRMLVFPMIMLFVLKYSGLYRLAENGRTILLVSLLAAMTPPASTVTQMAQVYGRDARYASAVNIVSTFVCIVTMPIMVYLYML
ncbi:MAG: AEC family transporter [Lachnospiraceae bacterium]|jgi:predicted permease